VLRTMRSTSKTAFAPSKFCAPFRKKKPAS
jgi:hypothetical protein